MQPAIMTLRPLFHTPHGPSRTGHYDHVTGNTERPLAELAATHIIARIYGRAALALDAPQGRYTHPRTDRERHAQTACRQMTYMLLRGYIDTELFRSYWGIRDGTSSVLDYTHTRLMHEHSDEGERYREVYREMMEYVESELG